MLTSDSLSTFRRIMFAITGLTCLAYAVLALLQMRPDPFPFWIVLMLYPIIGVLMAMGAVALPTAFAAMGTLMGAAYLLLFTYYDAKGHG